MRTSTILRGHRTYCPTKGALYHCPRCPTLPSASLATARPYTRTFQARGLNTWVYFSQCQHRLPRQWVPSRIIPTFLLDTPGACPFHISPHAQGRAILGTSGLFTILSHIVAPTTNYSLTTYSGADRDMKALAPQPHLGQQIRRTSTFSRLRDPLPPPAHRPPCVYSTDRKHPYPFHEHRGRSPSPSAQRGGCLQRPTEPLPPLAGPK